MITLSLCMIVKNEEDVLERCLSSVAKIMDEIIIVDTGSTDKTKEIASKFTDKIYDFKWVNHFSKARNYAFSKATCEYQMWLDADDVIEEEELKKIIQLKKSLNPAVDMVTLRYHTHFDEHGKPLLTSTRERIFKRENNYQWNDAIHEYILMQGNIQHEQIAISHKKIGSSGDRNLRIYQQLLKEGHTLSPRETYYYARELMDHGVLEESATYFNKFLDDGRGWYEDNIASCFNLGKIYNMLSQQEKVLPILLKSFQYDTPRGEICSQIGYYFKGKEDYKKAIYWFELALTLEKVSRGFVLNDYWDFIPAMELCVCYSKIGNIGKSLENHLLAKSLKPNAGGVLFNEKYFTDIGLIKPEVKETD